MKYTEFKTKFANKSTNPKQRLGNLIYTVHAYTIWCELSKKQQEACNEIHIENAMQNTNDCWPEASLKTKPCRACLKTLRCNYGIK